MWMFPGLEATGRVDIRGLFYRPASAASQRAFIARMRADGADTYCYYGDISSGSFWRLNKLAPAYSLLTNAGTASTVGAWVYFRYTYDPDATNKHTIKYWRETESEASPFRQGTSTATDAAVNGGAVGFGAGSTVPTTALMAWMTVGTGTDDADVEPTTDTPIVVSPISRLMTPASVALPDPGITISGIQYAPSPESVALPTIGIWDDFERASINPALSSVGVSDIGGDEAGTPLVVLRQRLQSIPTLRNNAWLEPCAKLTGVLGLRPRIEIVPFGDGSNHQSWTAAMRAHYSYDGETWYPIAAKTYSTRLTWRHDAAFTQDTVYVARSWPRSVTQVGNQVAALAAAHPTKIAPAPSAVGYTPSNPAGFPAPSYMVQEVSAKTDELGRAVPITPLYGFVIDDQAYGTKSKTAVITMGIHSGEDLGELVGWEMIDYLLGSSASAVALRQQTRILVYPLANPAGRWAGYWRGAPDGDGTPGSGADPNREWNSGITPSPTHDCVVKLRAVMLADVASYGDDVSFAFDIHASPGGSGRLQLGVNVAYPSAVEFDSLVRAKYPAGSWADYSDRNATPGSAATSYTLTGFHRWVLGAKLTMLNETCDAFGPVSPTVMRPYAEAQVDALADMDAEGWFDPPAVELSGAAVSISTATGTLTTSVQLAGSAASLSTAGGNLAAQITLSGAALAQAAATAALTAGAADLAGDAHATAAALGTLTTQIRLSGAAVSQALAGADLTTESAGLSGSAQASATAMGLLGTGIPLVGEATATASAAGSLGVPIMLSGAAAAVSSATGELTIALALEGHSLASALASGSLTTHIHLSGAALGRAAASGALAGTQIETPARRIYRVRYPARIMRVTT